MRYKKTSKRNINYNLKYICDIIIIILLKSINILLSKRLSFTCLILFDFFY